VSWMDENDDGTHGRQTLVAPPSGADGEAG
jgi:hypothetical protein